MLEQYLATSLGSNTEGQQTQQRRTQLSPRDISEISKSYGASSAGRVLREGRAENRRLQEGKAEMTRMHRTAMVATCAQCNKEFVPGSEVEGECVYHPGTYVRGGMMKWRCCHQKSIDAPGCKVILHCLFSWYVILTAILERGSQRETSGISAAQQHRDSRSSTSSTATYIGAYESGSILALLYPLCL